MNPISLDDESEAQNDALKQKTENEQRTRVDDLKWLMSSPRGRRLVWWLLDKAGVNRTSFNNSGSVMAFNEGQRNMGLLLQAHVIEAAADRYFEMLTESRSKK